MLSSTILLVMETKIKKVDSWNGAAELAVAEIEKSSSKTASQFTKVDTNTIRHEFEHLSSLHFYEDIDVRLNDIVAEKWAALGALSLLFAKYNSLTITNEYLLETLVRKQTDYGHNNIAKYGRQGLIIRVHDKIARLENLIAKNEVAKNEPIADTLLDIAGYSAIGIMWEKELFLLPLE